MIHNNYWPKKLLEEAYWRYNNTYMHSLGLLQWPCCSLQPGKQRAGNWETEENNTKLVHEINTQKLFIIWNYYEVQKKKKFLLFFWAVYNLMLFLSHFFFSCISFTSFASKMQAEYIYSPHSLCFTNSLHYMFSVFIFFRIFFVNLIFHPFGCLIVFWYVFFFFYFLLFHTHWNREVIQLNEVKKKYSINDKLMWRCEIVGALPCQPWPLDKYNDRSYSA